MDWASFVPALIPLLVPLALAGLKMAWPKIPANLLPILAPILGAVADLLSGWAGMGTFGPTWGAVLGSAGVGLREFYDQNKTWVGIPKP